MEGNVLLGDGLLLRPPGGGLGVTSNHDGVRAANTHVVGTNERHGHAASSERPDVIAGASWI